MDWVSCTYCGRLFYGRGVFCTEKCQELALHPPVYKPKPVTKKCHWCGKPCEKTYCSDECKKENSRSGSVARTCQYCGKAFMGSYTVKYCSDVCRFAGFKRMVVERKPDKCRVCGNIMPSENIELCSRECAIIWNAKRDETGL